MIGLWREIIIAPGMEMPIAGAVCSYVYKSIKIQFSTVDGSPLPGKPCPRFL